MVYHSVAYSRTKCNTSLDIACMAETMTFKELFHHLEEYVQDPERRWHYVMRVKRHLPDPNDLGGLGKDQCYFEGER